MADRTSPQSVDVKQTHPLFGGVILDLDVAASTTIYKGTFVEMDAGFDLVDAGTGSTGNVTGLVIDGADKLGLQHVNTFIGRDHRTSVEENFKRFRKAWPPIIRHAEKRGVTIGIENCPMYFGEDEWPGGKNLATTPAMWRRMFEEIPSPSFGLNYDPSHMIWQFMDTIKPIYEFRERIVHVHIKDARIRYDLLNEVGIMAPPLQFHQPKLPGLGDVDWGAFFAALTDIGYRGSACVEIEDRAYEGTLKDRKRALRQSLGYVRQFV